MAARITVSVKATPSGTGEVIIAWPNTAGGMNDIRADVLVLCGAAETDGVPTKPEGIQDIYVPARLSTSATLTPSVL